MEVENEEPSVTTGSGSEYGEKSFDDSSAAGNSFFTLQEFKPK